MGVAQHQASTSERTDVRECPADADEDLVTWAHDALGRMMLPEDGGDNVALTMEIEVQDESRALIKESRAVGEPEFFLSRVDREYVKLLVSLGYRDEAAGLVEQAHRAKFGEHCGHYAVTEGEDPPLFAIHDLEYLELLLIVGRREQAVELVLRLMDEYEISVLSKIVGIYEDRGRLETEYRSIIEAIDKEGFLPPERREEPSPRATSFLGRLFGAIVPRRA